MQHLRTIDKVPLSANHKLCLEALKFGPRTAVEVAITVGIVGDYRSTWGHYNLRSLVKRGLVVRVGEKYALVNS